MKQEIKKIIEVKVKQYNKILRDELLSQLKKGKLTMSEFESKTGLAHSFIFNFRNGKTQLRKIENFITVMNVLGRRIDI